MLITERLKQLMEQTDTNTYRLHKTIGCKITTISNWLSGASLPDAANLVKLADYFRVSLDYLVGRSDDPAIR